MKKTTIIAVTILAICQQLLCLPSSLIGNYRFPEIEHDEHVNAIKKHMGASNDPNVDNEINRELELLSKKLKNLEPIYAFNPIDNREQEQFYNYKKANPVEILSAKIKDLERTVEENARRMEEFTRRKEIIQATDNGKSFLDETKEVLNEYIVDPVKRFIARF